MALKIVEFVRKAEPNTVYRLHRSTKEPVVFPDGIFARPAETELYRDISK